MHPQEILPLFLLMLQSGHPGGPSDHMLRNPTQSSLARRQHPAQSRSDYVALGLLDVLAMITSQSTYGMANDVKLKISREWSGC